MSVLTTRTATCDVCKKTKGTDRGGDLPDGWVNIMLFRRAGADSRQVHHLDLCPRCQEIALDALEKVE